MRIQPNRPRRYKGGMSEPLPDTDTFLHKKWNQLLAGLAARANEYDHEIKVMVADESVLEVSFTCKDWDTTMEARVTDLHQTINGRPIVIAQEIGPPDGDPIIVEMHSLPIWGMLYSG